MSTSNNVFYKIIAERNSGGAVTKLEVAEMQWFDVYAYDQSKFYTDTSFATKIEAEIFIEDEIRRAVALLPLILSCGIATNDR